MASLGSSFLLGRKGIDIKVCGVVVAREGTTRDVLCWQYAVGVELRWNVRAGGGAKPSVVKGSSLYCECEWNMAPRWQNRECGMYAD